MDANTRATLNRLCYIFPFASMKDLKMAFDANSSPVDKVYFVQSGSAPAPENGFYAYEQDRVRHRLNVDAACALEALLVEHGGALKIGQVDNPRVVRAFLSVAHAGRTLIEMRECVDPDAKPSDFTAAKRAYERCIRLSFDSAAVKVLDTVARHPDQVTIFSIVDAKDVAQALPESVCRIVSEAFAGLAMIAVREGNPQVAVSYATAALFRHADMLPLVNCVRLVAVVRRMTEAVMLLTDSVILPFFLLSKHPATYNLHVKELRQWNLSQRSDLLAHARTVAAQAASFNRRFAGKVAIVRARMEDGGFVERRCAVCGLGQMGEKVFRCSGCSRICYCSRACQMEHWPKHKDGCAGK